MSMLPGTRIGAYEVTAQIGEGGMGEVYRATDSHLKRSVAIKVLPASVAGDADRLARFQREAEVLAALNHPNIAGVYGLEKSADVTALVMELVEGENLSAHIARGAIPVADALPMARQIADALEAAHEQGVVHRDLKPANIKVRADGTVKVLDFGLAKAMDPAGAASASSAMTSPTMTRLRQGYGEAGATELGMILGTAAYMSPEQARGKAVDKRADIWSFGVVVYEMLTGRRLFDGDTTSDVIASVLTREPDLSAVPGPWRRLIGRCLERDPRKRLRDIGDAWLLLDNEGVPVDATPRARGRIVWPWALGALAVSAVATWIAFTSRELTVVPAPVAMLEPPPPGTQFFSPPAPSPDGRWLAWIAADAARKTRLWTRQISETAPHAVEGTDGATMAFWSPDSLQLAFVAQGQVRRTAPAGGSVSLVVAANPFSGAWLADGDILLAMTGKGLMRVPGTGGSLRPASGFTSEAFRDLRIESLAASPDGRCLLFNQFGGETGVYVARLDGTGKRLLYPGERSSAVFAGPDLIVREDASVLVAQRFNCADLSLVGDGFPVAQNVGANNFAAGASGALTFIAGARGVSRLTFFTRSGTPAGVAGPDGEYTEVAISRRGRWLGFVRRDPADGNVDVWLQALSGGAPSRLTSDPDVDHLFTISHDEREVVWEAHAKGTLNLMRRSVDGSSPPQLVRIWGRGGGPCDWSPDGRTVVYRSDDGPSGSNLWAVPMGGSGDPVRLTQPGFGSDDGQFSPDGRWLAFTGEATGEKEVYVQRIDGTKFVGGPVRVSESGGEWPLWRGDGAELFFMSRGALMVTEFHDRSDRPVGSPRTLFTITGSGGYAVTPDGQRFVAIVGVTDPTPLPATVVLNWRAKITGKP